jgi:hypothetical protein
MLAVSSYGWSNLFLILILVLSEFSTRKRGRGLYRLREWYGNGRSCWGRGG